MMDLGHLDRRHGDVCVRFRRRLPYPPSKVWRAITEPEHLAHWFPTTIEGERAVGARLRFGFRNNEGEPFEGELLAFEPPSLLELRWGDEVLRFEVEADGTDSVLVFTSTFREIGKAARAGAGWHACLDALAFAVGGSAAPWSAADRWKQVRANYIDRFGPEASTIGPPEQWDRAHPQMRQEPGPD